MSLKLNLKFKEEENRKKLIIENQTKKFNRKKKVNRFRRRKTIQNQLIHLKLRRMLRTLKRVILYKKWIKNQKRNWLPTRKIRNIFYNKLHVKKHLWINNRQKKISDLNRERSNRLRKPTKPPKIRKQMKINKRRVFRKTIKLKIVRTLNLKEAERKEKRMFRFKKKNRTFLNKKKVSWKILNKKKFQLWNLFPRKKRANQKIKKTLNILSLNQKKKLRYQWKSLRNRCKRRKSLKRGFIKKEIKNLPKNTRFHKWKKLA